MTGVEFGAAEEDCGAHSVACQKAIESEAARSSPVDASHLAILHGSFGQAKEEAMERGSLLVAAFIPVATHEASPSFIR